MLNRAARSFTRLRVVFAFGGGLRHFAAHDRLFKQLLGSLKAIEIRKEFEAIIGTESMPHAPAR